MNMRLFSNNEWDQLKTVIVGTMEGFQPSFEFNTVVDQKLVETAQKIVWEAYPSSYIEEVTEDLEALCDILRANGVTILRPQWPYADNVFHTPAWTAGGFDIYNVRDLHIVFGNKLIVSAPSSRFRLFENQALQTLFYENFFQSDMDWICAPTPQLQGEFIRELSKNLSEMQKLEETLHASLSGGLTEVWHRLEEKEIIFDAANVIRFGQDILYLVSSTGNNKGAQWLQNTLPDYRVHITDAYRSSHLDSTILPLREGVVLLNGARVNESNTPELLNKWDKLYFNEPSAVCPVEIEFHKNVRLPAYHKLKDLGAVSSIGHISSPWAGLNVLSLSPDTVMVHDRQKELIKTLEAKRFNVIPIQMRHCYTMLGGLHCVTLDVERG